MWNGRIDYNNFYTDSATRQDTNHRAVNTHSEEASMTAIYFETSSINHILDNLSDDEIVIFREILLKTFPDTKLCLSPVTLWEISCTQNQVKKENLVHVCQLLLDQVYVFPSPIKILDNFISAGCPIYESQEGFWEKQGKFYETWRDVSINLEKTMQFDGQIIDEDRNIAKNLSKIIETLIHTKFSPVDNSLDNKFYKEYYEDLLNYVNSVFCQVKFIQEDIEAHEMDCKSRLLYKTTILFAICVLILGISIDGGDLKFFWKKRIESTNIMDQINFLFSHYETILHRGPLVYMAMMAIAQTSHHSNRGLYKDCFHAMYMPYCKIFFTADQHFMDLKNVEPTAFWGRIINIDDFISKIREITDKHKCSRGENTENTAVSSQKKQPLGNQSDALINKVPNKE